MKPHLSIFGVMRSLRAGYCTQFPLPWLDCLLSLPNNLTRTIPYHCMIIEFLLSHFAILHNAPELTHLALLTGSAWRSTCLRTPDNRITLTFLLSQEEPFLFFSLVGVFSTFISPLRLLASLFLSRACACIQGGDSSQSIALPSVIHIQQLMFILPSPIQNSQNTKPYLHKKNLAFRPFELRPQYSLSLGDSPPSLQKFLFSSTQHSPASLLFFSSSKRTKSYFHHECEIPHVTYTQAI